MISEFKKPKQKQQKKIKFNFFDTIDDLSFDRIDYRIFFAFDVCLLCPIVSLLIKRTFPHT